MGVVFSVNFGNRLSSSHKIQSVDEKLLDSMNRIDHSALCPPLFPIVGHIGERVLVGEIDSKLVAIGKSADVNFYTKKITCQRGEPIQITEQRIDLSNRLLGDLQDDIDVTQEHYLFGTLALYEGVSFDTVKLLIIILFVFIVNPTATHALAKAAYLAGVKPWRVGAENKRPKKSHE